MNKKIQIGIMTVVILTLLYLLWIELQKRNVIEELWVSDTTVLPPENVPILTIGSEQGCNSSYPTPCGQLDLNNPQTNISCCGEQVVNIQNQLQMLGQALNVDGRYGSQTAQAHQNALNEMGGTWFVSPSLV
jgi:hypothetical protein